MKRKGGRSKKSNKDIDRGAKLYEGVALFESNQMDAGIKKDLKNELQ